MDYSRSGGRPGFTITNPDGTKKFVSMDELERQGKKAQFLKDLEANTGKTFKQWEDSWLQRRGQEQLKKDEASLKPATPPAATTPPPRRQPPAPKPLTADQKSNLEYQKLREKDPEAAKKLGMEIWAKKYSDASGKSKFTVPSVEKSGPRVDVATTRQREIISAVRGNKPIPPVTPVTKTKVDTAPAGTPPPGMTLSRQYRATDGTYNDMPGRLGQLETGYAGKPVKKKPQPGAGAPMGGPYNEAYDVVLDYLLSEGHAETVEEAHYVMMQLDSEYIQSIVDN